MVHGAVWVWGSVLRRAVRRGAQCMWRCSIWGAVVCEQAVGRREISGQLGGKSHVPLHCFRLPVTPARPGTSCCCSGLFLSQIMRAKKPPGVPAPRPGEQFSHVSPVPVCKSINNVPTCVPDAPSPSLPPPSGRMVTATLTRSLLAPCGIPCPQLSSAAVPGPLWGAPLRRVSGLPADPPEPVPCPQQVCAIPGQGHVHWDLCPGSPGAHSQASGAEPGGERRLLSGLLMREVTSPPLHRRASGWAQRKALHWETKRRKKGAKQNPAPSRREQPQGARGPLHKEPRTASTRVAAHREELMSAGRKEKSRMAEESSSGSSSSPSPGDTLPWNLAKHQRTKRTKSSSGSGTVLDPAERAVIRIAAPWL
ncbi:hypothetical protein KIL84_011063 [Mauremys mutica]|uniref:Uncharacterized protein n=1 Tax=Mauremys mutica TaxID=74926 RepID=A0A9D4B202_9SAUR|nr:hypothetical protein KIL84_011063 [Mauremys mutica]